MILARQASSNDLTEDIIKILYASEEDKVNVGKGGLLEINGSLIDHDKEEGKE